MTSGMSLMLEWCVTSWVSHLMVSEQLEILTNQTTTHIACLPNQLESLIFDTSIICLCITVLEHPILVCCQCMCWGMFQCYGQLTNVLLFQWDKITVKMSYICTTLSSDSLPIANAFYGTGNGDILLDDVLCRGNERNLSQCRTDSRGEKNCTHTEDAGVKCNGRNDL